MTTRAQVKSFVTESSRLRKTASNLAYEISENIELSELIEDPEGYVRDLITALWAVLMNDVVPATAANAWDHVKGTVALRIAADDLDEIVDGTIRQLHRELRDAMGVRALSVANHFAELSIDGVSARTLAVVMATEASRKSILAPVIAGLSLAAIGIVGHVEKNVLDFGTGMAAEREKGGEKGSEEAQFEWITMSSDSSCDDQLENSCVPRDGLAKTWNEWVDLGLPGAGVLLCSYYCPHCHCVLQEIGQLRPEVTQEEVAEFLAAGKEQAA